ncbi:MAG: M3 family metallopeptidase [bacterium]|nr:M3 family metallopeptidase [bacterium]
MKSVCWPAFSLLVLVLSCAGSGPNPFDSDWNTPFGTPPFDQIRIEHYKPAILKGIKLENREIEAIVRNSEAPTFKNTIEALDFSGEYLSRVTNVFDNMTGSMTNDTMQALDKELAPIRSAHRDDILLNAGLFKRIKAVYDGRDTLNLNSEQNRALEEIYKRFVRNGANLNDADKAKLRKINEELSVLSVQFGENILKENNKFELVLDNQADLAGLPAAVITAAAETAKERGHEGKWAFTLHKPSLIPFLQYSEKRDLREKMFTAYITRGDHGDELDNKKILTRMASLRVDKAKLLGYATFAELALENSMAKNPKAVYDLLNQLWTPALKRAAGEADEMREMIKKEGRDFDLKPWDWWYYAERIKKAKYDLDEEALRPYLEMKSVRKGVFDTASRLFGLKFVERADIPKYHPDVETFEVRDTADSLIGILYTDYYPRASKSGGAWMSNFREQYKKDGRNIRPVIVNVGNFSKPTADQPSLLSLEEVETLFHEFGHALHGLLSQCTYLTLSGTSVPRDFVELPSQIMENWAFAPEVMKRYAVHYQTGKPIPDALIQKIRKAGLFNQGFATVEYLAASFLDMDWHTLTDSTPKDATAFEKASLERIGLMPEIVSRYRSPYFAHIFSGGYSAGYYSYIWAEVLDADAFRAFEKAGLFNPQLADAFRKNILEAGNTEDPMVLYQRFRGAPPTIDALLEKRGLK